MDESKAERTASGSVPAEVADWYDFPEGTGKGVRVAVLAFSGTLGGTDQVVMGGYDVEALTRYWLEELRQTAAPTLQDRVVRGPGNWPSGGDVDGTDFTDEVMLDLSVVGALAPEAEVTVWFTEPTEQGFVDALHAVVEEEHAPDVLLVCYGAPEDKGSGTSWTRMATEQADQALALAALRGVTVVVSCGDNGAAGLPLSTRVHADYPSSSAWVLGVGGTTRWPDNAGTDRETVWNDGLAASGGGISAVTPRPSWQSTVDVPDPVDAWERPGFQGRGVPDVAAVADLATGVAVRRRRRRHRHGRRHVGRGSGVGRPAGPGAGAGRWAARLRAAAALRGRRHRRARRTDGGQRRVRRGARRLGPLHRARRAGRPDRSPTSSPAGGQPADDSDGVVGTRSRVNAAAAASPRLLAPSFIMMLLTWTLTVFSLMNRARAICRLVRPDATSGSTSCSRGVSPSRWAVLAGAGLAAAGASTVSVARPASADSSRRSGAAPSSSAIACASATSVPALRFDRAATSASASRQRA